MLTPSDITRVLYRKNCCDSFAAAFCAWKVLGNNVVYEAVDFNDPIPNLEDEHVIMLGFSFGRAVIEDLMNTTYDLLILDYHESTFRSIGDLGCSIINKDKSTSHISWEYFNPTNRSNVPLFIQYIEDRELDKWCKKDSNEFMAYFYTCVQFNFNNFNEYLDSKKIEESINKGKSIIEFKNSIIKNELTRIVQKSFFNKNAFVINASRMVSDIGKAIAKMEDCDISIVWYYDHRLDMIRVTLRTEHDNINVNRIAKRFKGNGNAKCSRFIYGESIDKLFSR